ncbi:hypothetical protein B5M47_00225 [candidate division CPR3 bacterium 4484_211]|uniref:ParB/Sulfiredoxin domain-containing protein n=1 Tax=candidate division CPR3 bacterium 4484_211 TaxID=1968527 RepID=A0A1W9P174_UNCC3|nr:MAG: hypothetical protein B5M47_00225 [candidate division CPR3 bacterium 4484_211]
MDKFEYYLKKLADHEDEKSKPYLSGPRARILVNAGIRLNWLGDFLANPEIKWEERELPVEKIQFTGTSLKWNKVLIDQCGRSVSKFRALMARNPKLKEEFQQEASFGNEIILVRKSEGEGFYKVLDGMHRFMGAVLEGKEKLRVFLPINEDEHLPVCEAHTVYDLIRGFVRNAKDREGEMGLYHALKLLCRTYANVKGLLRERFNKDYVHDDKVQKIIKKVLEK